MDSTRFLTVTQPEAGLAYLGRPVVYCLFAIMLAAAVRGRPLTDLAPLGSVADGDDVHRLDAVGGADTRLDIGRDGDAGGEDLHGRPPLR